MAPTKRINDLQTIVLKKFTIVKLFVFSTHCFHSITSKQYFTVYFRLFHIVFHAVFLPLFQALFHSFITVRNKVAKVMFLQVSVCPQGGVCPSASWDTPSWADTPPGQRPPRLPQTATAADGTPPTGMHSYCIFHALFHALFLIQLYTCTFCVMLCFMFCFTLHFTFCFTLYFTFYFMFYFTPCFRCITSRPDSRFQRRPGIYTHTLAHTHTEPTSLSTVYTHNTH